MTFVEISRETMLSARALADLWSIPDEIVLAYLVSERHLPTSIAALEEWANRPSPYPARRTDDGGPWHPVGVT